MGKWSYRKIGDPCTREVCVRCNLRQQKKVAGKNKYRALCSKCDNELYRSEAASKQDALKRDERLSNTQYKNHIKEYRKHKKDKCEFCGFIPVHSCQLDVDHIDGNHYNNDLENLQTLCANCHRLKTMLHRNFNK